MAKNKKPTYCRTNHTIVIMLLNHKSLHFHKFIFLTHQPACNTISSARSAPSVGLSLVFFRRGKSEQHSDHKLDPIELQESPLHSSIKHPSLPVIQHDWLPTHCLHYLPHTQSTDIEGVAGIKSRSKNSKVQLY